MTNRIQWLQQKYGSDSRPSRSRRPKGSTEESLKNVLEKVKQVENFNKLDLFAPVPNTLKPCGFTGDTLTEAVWLPYRNQENAVMIKPAVIMSDRSMPKHKPFKIIDFLDDDHDIKGTFPSQELQTLMSVKSVQMLEHMANVEPQDVDKKIEESLQKHLSIPRAEMILCKRWIEGTYFFDVFDAYPIESILGVSESGKSRLCLVNLALCYHAEGMIDPSEASIFRNKQEDRISLVVDEAEYLNNPNLYSTLRILINASYSKESGYVCRYDEDAEGRRVKRRFDLYSPMALSGIASVEGVTLSRAFRIVMRRTNKDYPKAYAKDYGTLRDMLYTLRVRHAFDVYDLYKSIDISNIVSARFEELFKPLFCMTKFFGNQEEWQILAQWAKDYQDNFRVEALNVAQEEMVLLSLSKITSYPNQPEWYELKELTNIINDFYSTNFNPKTISNILYRLGLTRRKKIHGLTLVYATKEQLEACASNIGVEFSSPNTAPTAPMSTTSPDWLQEKKEVKGET
jgi:hypothetical protein